MSDVSVAAIRPASGGHSVRETVLGFVRLSKVAVFQHYFGLALAWLLLSSSARDRPGATLAMIAFLIGSIGIVAATCALDDIVGFRNGSDAINYQHGETKRDIRRKPLLSGVISESQAIVFVVAAIAVAVLAGLAAFWALDWHAPLAAYVLYSAGLILSLQYSAGLRVSYYQGGGELLLFAATACGLYAPFLAVAQEWTSAAVLQGVLLGLWMVMVSSYSNVNDITGDRRVGRKTMATVASHATIATTMVLLVIGSVAATVWLVAGTEFPWWTLLTMLPATALHVSQLYVGPLRRQWLQARRLGMIAYNLGFLGIGIPTFYLFVTV
ncbi:UbiA family prenyltransferase [Nocardia iowensis]|nr:UbiA family prenyltransferase [Nocardia iowensis]